MVYSLKDAAERNRLTGTTFIQLNFMVGLWALAGKCLYLALSRVVRQANTYSFYSTVGIGQGTKDLDSLFRGRP